MHILKNLRLKKIVDIKIFAIKGTCIFILGLLANCVFAQPPPLQVLGLFKDKAYIVYKNKGQVVSAGEQLADDLKLVAADSKRAVFEYQGEKYIFGISFYISSAFEEVKSKDKPAAEKRPTPEQKLEQATKARTKM